MKVTVNNKGIRIELEETSNLCKELRTCILVLPLNGIDEIRIKTGLNNTREGIEIIDSNNDDFTLPFADLIELNGSTTPSTNLEFYDFITFNLLGL